MKVSLELTYEIEEFARHEFGTKRYTVQGKSGVYILMDKRGTVLYVGMSRDLGARLRAHISGYSNVDTSRLEKIRVLLTQSTSVADMLETYMIRELRPLFNINKTEQLDVEDESPDHMYIIECRIKETQDLLEELMAELEYDRESYEEDGDSATDKEMLGRELYLLREVGKAESLLVRLRREKSLLRRRGAVPMEIEGKTAAGLKRIATRRTRYGDARGWFIRDNAVLGGVS